MKNNVKFKLFGNDILRFFYKIICIATIIFSININLFSSSKLRSKARLRINKHQAECEYNMETLVTSKNYTLETHYVKTEDDYILKIFRIPYSKEKSIRHRNHNEEINHYKKGVLLVHGLIDSSDSWLANYENKSLPFVLANKGYDVWLANSRGNKHSRNHTILNPDKNSTFWNFTFEEMGTKDIPAILDFMISERKKNYDLKNTFIDKFTYIGHSQGTAQLFAALTIKLDYFKSKLNGMIALGPVSKMEHFDSFLVKQFSENQLEKLYDIFDIHEVFNSKEQINNVNKILCDLIPSFCGQALEMISDKSVTNNDNDKFLVWSCHYPSGTSSKNIAHFSQMVRDKAFENFNKEPYLLDLIKDFSISMFVGKDDKLSTTEDSRKLRNIFLQNNSLYFYKEYSNYGHSTFFLNKDYEYINDVLDSLKYFNKE